MNEQIPHLEQTPFSAVGFAENPEPRCPCLLLLDTSASMRGQPINELNTGIRAFKDELLADSLAAKRVEVSVITFGPVHVHNDFQTADFFLPPELKAEGMTPMGEAIERAADIIQQRKAIYRANGVQYYRPWIFLITDGAPTDEWHRAANLVREGEVNSSFIFFAVGVENANIDILRQICSARDPLKLKELRFRDLFQWLSSSLRSVSSSRPGDQVALPSPQGWASVDV